MSFFKKSFHFEAIVNIIETYFHSISWETVNQTLASFSEFWCLKQKLIFLACVPGCFSKRNQKILSLRAALVATDSWQFCNHSEEVRGNSH